MRTVSIFLPLLLVFPGCGGGDEAAIKDTDIVGDDDDDGVGDDDDATGDPCSTWVNTYDLTGSKFFIEAQMNFTITLQEPYGADLNMGPGSVTLRFADNGGVADGSAFLTDYDLTQDFVTGINLASVHTDLQNDAVDSCGVATGDLAGTALTWAPMSMADHCQNGQISCTGLLCGSFGAPAEDTPEVITDDCGDHPLETFNFSPDLSSFTMEAVVLSQDENATAALNYVGTLVSSDLDPNTPACLCP